MYNVTCMSHFEHPTSKAISNWAFAYTFALRTKQFVQKSSSAFFSLNIVVYFMIFKLIIINLCLNKKKTV